MRGDMQVRFGGAGRGNGPAERRTPRLDPTPAVKRRDLLNLGASAGALGLLCGCGLLPAQAPKLPLIGYLSNNFADDPAQSDQVVEAFGVRVLVDPKSGPIVGGSTLDFNDALLGGGLRMINPQAKHECACGDSFSI